MMGSLIQTPVALFECLCNPFPKSSLRRAICAAGAMSVVHCSGKVISKGTAPATHII